LNLYRKIVNLLRFDYKAAQTVKFCYKTYLNHTTYHMNKLEETLLILHHFDSLISSRTDFCRRHADFNIKDCVTSKLLDMVKQGRDSSELKNDEISKVVSRQCADIKITLHSYICLNIIDMFSFNDEYNDFFHNQRFDDITLKERINKVKKINKEIRKGFDWDQLKKIRNTVLAHNLRDNTKSSTLALTNLKELYDILSNLKSSISYCETTMLLFDNIKNEFEDELIQAQRTVMLEIRKLYHPE
jgi:hypothetical protein